MNPEAVIFDVDGVITNYAPLSVNMFITQMHSYGIELSLEEMANHYSRMTGQSIMANYEYSCRNFGLNAGLERFLSDRRNLRLENKLLLELNEGLLDLLKYIKAKGIKIGLATSSDRLKIGALSDLFPREMSYFTVKVTRENVTHHKPHPEPFLKAAELLGVSPSKSLVIEDSINGLRSAIDGGFNCIVMKNPYIQLQDYLPIPLKIVTNLGDIIDFI